jgi:lipoprotein-anchoring transpeptidase ErfK/SrfK
VRRFGLALAAAALGAGALGVAACGGAQDDEEAAPAPPARPATTTAPAVAAPPARPSRPAVTRPPERPSTRCTAGALRDLGSEKIAYAAIVRGAAAAFRVPGSRPVARFGRLNANGVPTVFGILGRVQGPDCKPWYRVQLPMRPNGLVGYVRARDVVVERVRTRISVDLSSRRVTLYRDGRAVLTVPAAIGTPATPTPIGRFYVNQRLIPRDPTGPFGPGAIGISAFSPVLTGWAQGGPIAIHGTNRPDLIGQRVSNGCIRVRNEDLRRLFDATLSGTPVTIHP